MQHRGGGTVHQIAGSGFGSQDRSHFQGKVTSDYGNYKGEAYIKQEEICEAIGLSYKTRKVVTDCIEALIKGGFINVKNNFKVHTRVNKKGDTVEHIIPNYYYSLSEDYLLEAKKN